MRGVPSIRGLRIPVATVVGMVADGMDEEEILEAYPDLEREVLRYAAEAKEALGRVYYFVIRSTLAIQAA